MNPQDNPYLSPHKDSGSLTEPAKQEGKLPPSAHLMSGWPLLLVAIGGLIGGALGGAAYGINVALSKSSLPVAAKVVLNVFVGIAAIGIWLAVAIAIQAARA